MTRQNSKKGSKPPRRPPFKVIIEKHADGYVAYPLGLKGVVVGQGDSYEAAMADVKSAIRFHIETFGEDVREVGRQALLRRRRDSVPGRAHAVPRDGQPRLHQR